MGFFPLWKRSLKPESRQKDSVWGAHVASSKPSLLLSTDGVGERLRCDRDAHAAGGERREAVLPLLA